MFPSGLIVPTVATATVVPPMLWVFMAADKYKRTPHRVMPSVRESILTSLAGTPAPRVPKPPTPPVSGPKVAPAETLTVAPAKAQAATTAPSGGGADAVAPLPAAPAAKPKTAPTVLPSASGNGHPLTAAVTKALGWARSHSLTVLSATAVVGLALFKVYTTYTRSTIRRRMMSTDDSQKLQLYVIANSSAHPGVSAPCATAEIFLRLAKVPYEVHTLDDVRISPTGNLPLLRYKGNCLDTLDSIIAFVTSTFNVKLDKYLTEKEKAIGVALAALAKYCAWWSYKWLPRTEKRNAVKSFLVKLLQKAMMSDELSLKRAMQTGQEEDLQAIEKVIGAKNYLLGSTPTSYDCALYALLLPLAPPNVDGAAAYVANSRVLTGYMKRMSHSTLAAKNGESVHTNGRSR